MNEVQMSFEQMQDFAVSVGMLFLPFVVLLALAYHSMRRM
jgi:hypothetical protein